MTPPNAEQLLIIAVANLRRSSPDAWTEFSNAMQNYVGYNLIELTKAPPVALPTFQGQVRSLVALNKLFEDSLEKADKILENRRPK